MLLVQALIFNWFLGLVVMSFFIGGAIWLIVDGIDFLVDKFFPGK